MEQNKTILYELKTNERAYKKILKQLVKDRIRKTENNKFELKEIKYWSEYFNISINDFIFQVLKISVENYKKVLKGNVKYFESIEYKKQKDKMLTTKRNIYYRNRNLNTRIYYDKDKLVKQADKQNINIVDFTISVLGKSRESLRKVLKDEKGRRRLFIGKYVNAQLPWDYIEKNSKEIYKISRININRVSAKKQMTIRKEDKEDLVQDCINYIIENGNMLDKHGNPIIVNEFASKRNKRKIASKIYYYAMKSIDNYRNKNSTFLENIRYESYIEDAYKETEEKVERCIYENISNKFEQEILLYLYKNSDNGLESNIQKISNKYNLEKEQINEILDRNKKIFLDKDREDN